MERMSGWTLFRIRGVAVTLHVSLLLLLFYVFLVGSAQFQFVLDQSNVDPAQILSSPFLWGLIFAVALVVSIFVHEFAHVLMAQTLGAKVDRITLMMLGGVSEIGSLPEKPITEFKVAIIGPLVSLAIGYALLSLQNSEAFPNLAFFGYWVGQLNIGLAIFNILPAFPTDGGRVLRSILAHRQGHLRGTQNAVRVSNVFSVGFALIGIFQFNLLLLLIAFFIYSSAKNELFYLVAENALKGLKAGDLVIPIAPISEDLSISEAAKRMLESKVTALPVDTQSEAAGIVDASALDRVPRDLWDEVSVAKAETIVPHAVELEEPLENVLKTGMASGASSMPVKDQNKIVGVVRMADLWEAIQLQKLKWLH